MNLDRIKEILARIPVIPVFLVFIAYQAYDYYSFTSDPASPLMQKRETLNETIKENTKLEEKLKLANEFYRTLDQKRAELRSLAQKLDEMKAVLTEDLDIASVIKLVVTEARKIGLTVTGIKPTTQKTSEYYAEQTFELTFKGVYVQMLVFLERLSSLERIIRTDDVAVKRIGSSSSQYVEIGGTLLLKTYRYLGSKADEIAKAGGSPAPAGTAPPPVGGQKK